VEEARLVQIQDEKKNKETIKQAIENGRNRPMLLASYNQSDKNKHDAQLATARRFLEVLIESGMS